MKRPALIYALWDKNIAVLQHYLRDKSRLVVVPSHLASERLRRVVQSSASGLHILPMGGAARCADAADALLEKFAGGTSTVGLPDGAGATKILQALSEEVAADLPGVQGWLNVLDALSGQVEIEITVVNEDVMRDAKTLALWSRARHIPVLHVAHGTGLNRDYSGDAIHCDHVAVPSQRSAEYFQDLGMQADKIHVVGNANWDVLPDMVRNRTANRAKLSELYRLPPAGQWLVWGSTWNAYLSVLDNRDFAEQAVQACVAMAALKRAGLVDVTLIFKDRLDTAFERVSFEDARDRFMAIAAANGVADQVRYVADDSRHWAACGDVVVSYNSNFAIEAVLSHTPAINLVTDFSALTGGGFGADDGVLVLEFNEVPGVLERLCRDAAFRGSIVADAAGRRSFYNASGDGDTALRTAELIGKYARKIEGAAQAHVWQRYLDAGYAEVTACHASGRSDLVAMFSVDPAIAMDIGCAAGDSGALMKRRFPQARVWGTEASQTAADTAKQTLDRVLFGNFEDLDLEREGMAKGTLDAVLLDGVLERVMNPWALMVKLHPYMSAAGQIALCISNMRNLMVLDDLSKGNWSYTAHGLLDITHIRFFTLSEISRLCRETGYRVIRTDHAIDIRLDGLWNAAQTTPPAKIETDRLSFKNVTFEEVRELCTVQFNVLVEKDQG